MYRILLICLVLVACSDESKESAVKLPIYKNCLNDVLDYEKSINDKFKSTSQNLEVNISYFHETSEVHQDIVGYVELLGENIENFELDVNSIKGMCFPEQTVKVSKDELGLRVLDSKLSENKDKNINTYFRVTESEYILYFNDR